MRRIPLPAPKSITYTRERGFQPPYHTVAHYTCPKCGHVTNLRMPRGGFPPGAFACSNCGTVMSFRGGQSRRKGADRRRGPLTLEQEKERRRRAAKHQGRDRFGRFGK